MPRNSVPILLAPMFICLSATAQFLDRPIDRMDSLGNIEARGGNTYAMVEVQAVHAGDHVPFWMRSLQYGSVPLNGTSVSAIATFVRNYEIGKPKKLDWGGGFQLRTNIGGQDPTLLTEDENKGLRSQAILSEAYVKVKYGKVEFRAGRSREMFGFSDSTLGSGSFVVSGNALGIPKVGISIPDYSFPLFKGLLSFRGNFTYGWLGETPINDRSMGLRTVDLNTFYHQKSLYMRIGREKSKVRGYLGIDHHAFWFHGWELFGDSYEFNGWQEFWSIVTGRDSKYKPDDPSLIGSGLTTNVGNHLASPELGLEIPGKMLSAKIYHQFLFESQNTGKPASELNWFQKFSQVNNLRDGLTGISITNMKPRSKDFTFRKAVFEYFHTLDQRFDPSRPFNVDSYYNHEYFMEGSSYKNLIIGNPFITHKDDMRSNLPKGDRRNISNNTRIRLFHLGLEGSMGNLVMRTRLSISNNLGVWETVNSFPRSNQFSGMLEAGMALKKGWQARALFAFDSGSLLYNSAGGFLSIARIF